MSINPDFTHSIASRPLHQYQRFQDLLKAVFRIELLLPNPEKFIRVVPPKALMSAFKIDMVLEIFAKGMKEEKSCQNPPLRELAEIMNISNSKLSWLLNERIVQNFNEYINSFHLENSKEIALNPANSHLTHLALAYESGFKSTSVFHAFFKKTMG